jgi:hypothetical protein
MLDVPQRHIRLKVSAKITLSNASSKPRTYEISTEDTGGESTLTKLQLSVKKPSGIKNSAGVPIDLETAVISDTQPNPAFTGFSEVASDPEKAAAVNQHFFTFWEGLINRRRVLL